MSQDPFFGLSEDSTWNACIGQQGDELHYVEGYLEAASELANAVIDKNMLAKRDTLVLPILYNARHAIELVLKYVAGQLFDCGVIAQRHPADHDIKGLWDHLVAADVADEAIRNHLKTLERFVISLDRIDDDGQELRYHVNRDGETSLKGQSLANIVVIRDSIKELTSVVDGLMHRTIGFVAERKSGTYTSRCSRAELITRSYAFFLDGENADLPDAAAEGYVGREIDDGVFFAIDKKVLSATSGQGQPASASERQQRRDEVFDILAHRASHYRERRTEDVSPGPDGTLLIDRRPGGIRPRRKKA